MRARAAYWTRGLQWLIALSVAVAVGGFLVGSLRAKPTDTLYITLGDTRSRAAEVREIAHNAGAERTTATYVRAQAEQLVPRIEALRKDLSRAQSSGSASAGAARRAAERLLAITQSLAARADSPPAAGELEADAGAIVDELISIEQRERPD